LAVGKRVPNLLLSDGLALVDYPRLARRAVGLGCGGAQNYAVETTSADGDRDNRRVDPTLERHKLYGVYVEPLSAVFARSTFGAHCRLGSCLDFRHQKTGLVSPTVMRGGVRHFLAA
jgi:hypothetical protein